MGREAEMDKNNLTEELARAGSLAPSADNCQPWRIEVGEGRLGVYAPSESFFFGPGDHATLLAMGAVAENIAQTADANSVRGRFEIGDLSSGDPYFTYHHDNVVEKLVIPQGVIDRHTNRHPYSRSPLPLDLVSKIEATQEGMARVVVLSSREAIAEFGRISTKCSECRFQNPELHRWLMDSLRFTPDEVAGGEGLDIQTLHLPPGGRAFMRFVKDWRRMAMLNKFGAYRLLARAEADVLLQSGAVLLIVGTNEGGRSAFDAGRLMERIWMELNTLGWAVQPAYVVPDQINRMEARLLSSAINAVVGNAMVALRRLAIQNPQDRIHLALRVGRPTHVPIRSRRRVPDESGSIPTKHRD